jgi:PAS domain S-box-containing protein
MRTANIKNPTFSEEALKDSETRYRRLFETAQDGILILDAETGVIVDVNPFLMSLLDYSREEFVGKELWQIGLFKDIEASKNLLKFAG